MHVHLQYIFLEHGSLRSSFEHRYFLNIEVICLYVPFVRSFVFQRTIRAFVGSFVFVFHKNNLKRTNDPIVHRKTNESNKSFDCKRTNERSWRMWENERTNNKRKTSARFVKLYEQRSVHGITLT